MPGVPQSSHSVLRPRAGLRESASVLGLPGLNLVDRGREAGKRLVGNLVSSPQIILHELLQVLAKRCHERVLRKQKEGLGTLRGPLLDIVRDRNLLLLWRGYDAAGNRSWHLCLRGRRGLCGRRGVLLLRSRPRDERVGQLRCSRRRPGRAEAPVTQRIGRSPTKASGLSSPEGRVTKPHNCCGWPRGGPPVLSLRGHGFTHTHILASTDFAPEPSMLREWQRRQVISQTLSMIHVQTWNFVLIYVLSSIRAR